MLGLQGGLKLSEKICTYLPLNFLIDSLLLHYKPLSLSKPVFLKYFLKENK